MSLATGIAFVDMHKLLEERGASKDDAPAQFMFAMVDANDDEVVALHYFMSREDAEEFAVGMIRKCCDGTA